MHDRIARSKIIQAYLIGAVGGAILMLIFCAREAPAHNCENDDIECGYEWVYTEDGEEVSQYVCR